MHHLKGDAPHPPPSPTSIPPPHAHLYMNPPPPCQPSNLKEQCCMTPMAAAFYVVHLFGYFASSCPPPPPPPPKKTQPSPLPPNPPQPTTLPEPCQPPFPALRATNDLQHCQISTRVFVLGKGTSWQKCKVRQKTFFLLVPPVARLCQKSHARLCAHKCRQTHEVLSRCNGTMAQWGPRGFEVGTCKLA